jgi:hypothetical protein
VSRAVSVVGTGSSGFAARTRAEKKSLGGFASKPSIKEFDLALTIFKRI